MTNQRLTCPICMHREAGLIPAPRHVPAWDDLTGPEQMTMLAEVGAALVAARLVSLPHPITAISTCGKPVAHA